MKEKKTTKQAPVGKPETDKKNAAAGSPHLILIALLVCAMVLSTFFAAREWFIKPSLADANTQGTTLPTTQGADPRPSTTEPTTTVVIPSTGPADIRFPDFSEEIWLIGDAARAYLSAENVGIVGDFLWPYFANGQRNDIGLPVKLSYIVYSIPEGCTVTNAVYELSEHADFSDAKSYIPEADSDHVDIYGLFTGRQYYCRAFLTLSDGTVHTITSSFYTAASPRILTIDGIVNVRDFGGWQTVDGKTVRQGLLYRGSELDGVNVAAYQLTDKGIVQMRELLGIRMDMDLRGAGEDVLGENVTHTYYNAVQYAGAFSETGSAAVRKVFTDLANADRYPIYMHCTYGADRTGTMCYLLGAILGISDEDLMREYELTAMTFQYVSDGLMAEFLQQLATYEGETTQEKAENFLLSIGVTEQELESIRNIFLEDKPEV